MDIPFAELRAALADLAARDVETFHDVCAPMRGARVPAAKVPPDILAALVAGGVVRLAGDRVVPRLWIALRRGRPYCMSLREHALGDIYAQDLWPETEALLDRLAGAPAGRFLDVGTGSGVVAIEAALAGHQVTATDVYPDVLDLAAWNAALHSVHIELLAGHLFAPVAGRQFDLAMIAPHYGGAADMLRVETLRDGPAVLAPGGTLVVATFLESEGDHVSLVESMLTPMAQAGAQVSVRPYHATQKERWFTRPDPAVAGMVARRRFVIEIGRPRAEASADSAATAATAATDARHHHLGWVGLLSWSSIAGRSDNRALTHADHLPADPREAIIPLAHLVDAAARHAVRPTLGADVTCHPNRRPAATLTTADDVAALARILADCAAGVVDLTTPIPFVLHDACRLGDRPCVDAHAALVDARGGIRPCSHGQPVGTVATDTMASFHERMIALRHDLETRRGCVTCPAEPSCSKCAFPAVLAEPDYCDVMRRHIATLPRFIRLTRLLVRRFPAAIGFARLAVKLGPSSRLLFAVRRPASATRPDPETADLASRLAARHAALVACDAGNFLDLADRDPWPLTPSAAGILELVMEGYPRDAIAEATALSPDDVDGVLWFTGKWLGN